MTPLHAFADNHHCPLTQGLRRERCGFIQTHLADRVRFRNTPALRFVQDESIRKGIEMEDLIRKARNDGEDEVASDAATEE